MYPRITIITPSFNQANYLEQTIQSIIAQNYPNLQYIVVDGGSTDDTVEIIKKYGPHIDRWVSEPDNGPAHAINKGLEMADGEWVNWLNSDDFLFPGALTTMADAIRQLPTARWLSGVRMIADENGGAFYCYNNWPANIAELALHSVNFAQEATFIRRDFLDQVGGRLNEKLHGAFDTELYMRLIQMERPVMTNFVLGAFRKRPDQLSRDLEKQRADFAKLDWYFETRPFAVKFLSRLSMTRFHRAVCLAIELLVRLGLVERLRTWPAIVQDHISFEPIVTTVHRVWPSHYGVSRMPGA